MSVPCPRDAGAKILFIEVSNTDEHFLSESYRSNVQSSPDYRGVEDADALDDFRRRVRNYTGVYEPIDPGLDHPVEGKWSYFKCDHSKHHFVVHRVRGHVLLKVVHFIMNMRTTSHAFYLSRHGQSEYNEASFSQRDAACDASTPLSLTPLSSPQ